jgi:superfamily II DNA or RNA helicase
MATLELNVNLLAEIGGWQALKEARGLVERGKVSEVRREGETIRARVQGAEKIYDAQITLADRVAGIEVRCTCIESRRSGRVCAHALAAGLAMLQPAKTPGPKSSGFAKTPTTGPKRWLIEEAPAEASRIEVTVLLPLQLAEGLAKDPVRIILEGRRGNDEEAQPWDSVVRDGARGFAVSEEDERVLRALESMAGGVSGIAAVPRTKIGGFLRVLDGHPRVWLGKKQRITVRASSERPVISLCMRGDHALELNVASSGATTGGNALPISGWTFDGGELAEATVKPPGFTSAGRVIFPAQIPEFLQREWPALERTCELVFAPGFEEFCLEMEKPVIEARLDGALAGVTLDLVARYGEKAFPLGGRVEVNARETYFPDARQPNRFWRRDIALENKMRTEVEAAGFKPVKSGGTTFSLIHENQVARFLANTLPRWRESWVITFGSRLEATMQEVDVAEPEFTLRPGAGNDWLSLDLKLSVRGQPIPLEQAEIQRWLQTGQSHARTADKRVLLVPTEAWGEMREVLADCAVEQEPGRIRIEPAYAPFLTRALTAEGFRSRGTESASIAAPDVKAVLDAKLWMQLRPYQAKGVEWLAGLGQRNLNGLLADDMGLGKTLQALAFCAWLRAAAPPLGTAAATTERILRPAQDDGRQKSAHAAAKSESSPVLVVCPTSLVTNWLREAARFTPHLRALDLTGADRAERWAKRGEYDLLMTSYAILRRDVEQYRSEEFSLVILDEAQHIKNRGSQNAQSAKALRARHRLILTGTPLENSVLDLWSLFDFLLPGYLGTATDFRERYETPLTRDESGPVPRVMERLRHRVRPFFLRRTKEDVLSELPPKLEHLALCELTNEQREVYRAVLAQGRREVFEHAGKSGRGRDRIAVLTTLLRLRQVCCHLDLLPQGDEKRVWKEPSAKLDRTFELIDEAIDGGHRVLVFSQFVRALHLLRDEAARREIGFCYLDGQTVKRQAEVDRFQQDAGVPLFFISLKAGGTGLNLTGADTVIHFDPWWNPAVEEQATSRAHRMGQSRRVQAYKLIAAGTVEEKIQALQMRKRELFAASLGGDEAFAEKLTGEDLEELLAE